MQYSDDFLTGGSASGYPDNMGSPSNAFDNNESSYWGSASGGRPTSCWLKYDLGSGVTKKARKLCLKAAQVSGSYYGIQGFALYGSNNDNDWTLLTSGEQPNDGTWREYTFLNAVNYRYYKFVFNGSWYSADYTLVAEIELREIVVAPGGDILTGGTASCCSGANDPETACDNNESNYWYSVISTPGSWWAYDTTDSKKVRKLRMKAVNIGYGACGIKDWVLYGSNDSSNWTQISSGTQQNNESWQEYTFDNWNSYRYYKLAFPGGSYYSTDRVYIYEIEMYEVALSPGTPSTPSGPSAGAPGSSYNFSTSSTDPDGLQVKLQISWGDGNQSESGYVNSGQSVSLSHAYTTPGTYTVKAIAENTVPLQSGWSSTATIVIAAPGSYARVMGLW